VLLAGIAAAAIPARLDGELEGPQCKGPCDPGDVNVLDRTVIGYDSHGARIASDVLLGAGIALPFALDLLDVTVSAAADGASGFAADLVVLAETLTIDVGVTNVVKYTARRTRPYAYDEDAGALGGAAVGLLVPYLHTRRPGRGPAGVAWRLVPQAVDGGAVLSAMIF
jgi:hypothetical protein